jgi:hypothetical protein
MVPCTEPVGDAELARRIMPIAQRAALAPFPFPRWRPAPWGLNRRPFDFRELSEFGWVMEQKLEVGEEGLVLGGAPGAPAPGLAPTPAQQQRARGVAVQSGCQEYKTVVLTINDNTQPAATWASITSEALPAPCRIEQITLMPLEGVTANFQHARLLLVDQEFFGESAAVQGEDLVSNAQFANNGTAAAQSDNGFPLPNATTGGGGVPMVFHVGRAIYESGKRLQFSILNTAAGIATNRWQLYATVLLCIQPVAVEPISATRVQARAQPRPPAPAPIVAPPPPAPRPLDGGGGAFPVMAMVATTTVGISQVGQRWSLPEWPGLTFATLAEAQLYQQSRQVSALPPAQRAGAATALRERAGTLIYGGGELATPSAFLLGPALRG